MPGPLLLSIQLSAISRLRSGAFFLKVGKDEPAITALLL
jgi:hypothetical protein